MESAIGHSATATTVVWKVVALILLTNVLIALLSDTVSHIFSNMYQYVTMERAIIVIADMQDEKTELSESEGKVVKNTSEKEAQRYTSFTETKLLQILTELDALKQNNGLTETKLDEVIRKLNALEQRDGRPPQW